MLARLGTIFERTASVATTPSSHEVLDDVARAIGEVLGYRAVVINIYRYAFDDMLTAAAVGSDALGPASSSARSRRATPGRRC